MNTKKTGSEDKTVKKLKGYVSEDIARNVMREWKKSNNSLMELYNRMALKNIFEKAGKELFSGAGFKDHHLKAWDTDDGMVVSVYHNKSDYLSAVKGGDVDDYAEYQFLEFPKDKKWKFAYTVHSSGGRDEPPSSDMVESKKEYKNYIDSVVGLLTLILDSKHQDDMQSLHLHASHLEEEMEEKIEKLNK